MKKFILTHQSNIGNKYTFIFEKGEIKVKVSWNKKTDAGSYDSMSEKNFSISDLEEIGKILKPILWDIMDE